MKLSIIIPVYNTAPYLDDCINSILAQKDVKLGKDYEIICVNDGSTDDSEAVLNRIGKKIADNNRGGYLVVNQLNSGVSTARNNGLAKATGDYVWFVDSDDCIEPNCLASILEELVSNDLDWIRIEKTDVPEDFKPDLSQNSFRPYKTELFLGPATAVNFIVRREYLLEHEISFDKNISYGEDTLWVCWIYFFENRHVCLTNRVYFYRQRKTSAMGCVNRQKHFDSMLRMAKIYKSAYERLPDYPKSNQLLSRARESAQNTLFDAARISIEQSKRTLETLQNMGLYPYPLFWRKVTLRYGVNNFIVNAVSLLFPIKIYYLAVCNGLSIIRNLSAKRKHYKE